MIIDDLFVPFADELQLLPSPRFPDPPLLEWHAAFGDFFFRLKGADPQILWCDLGYMITPKRPLPPPRPTTLARRVSRAFRGRSFFRVIPFADGDDWALVLPKRALVKSPHQPAGAWWQWNAKFPTWGKTQLQWLSQPLDWSSNWLNEQHHRSEKLRDAREFAHLNDEEKRWSPIIASTEVRQHWEQLVRALQLLAFPRDQTPQQWQVCGKQTRKKLIRLSLEADLYVRSRLPEPNLTAALKLRDELASRFAIEVDVSRWRSLEPNGERHFYAFPQFALDSVSMHQKMEAALLWRDFLAQSSNRTELEAALHELIN